VEQNRRLPRHFLEISVAKSAWLIVYASFLYLSGAAAVLSALAIDISYLLAAPIIVFGWLIAAFGLNLFLWIGHEGGHGNLHPDKYRSTLIGILASFPVAPQSAIGFSASHMDHHRFANREGDPNLDIYRHFRGFWSRLLLSPGRATRRYRAITQQMLRGDDLPFRSGLSLDKIQLRHLAKLNIIVQATWLLAVIIGLVFFPIEALLAYIIPGFLSRSYNGIRPYLEHAGLGDQRGQESRTRSSWFWTVLEAGNNYHQEHHLYPRVPCYKLPALHRYLKEQGISEITENVDPSVLGAFRHSFRSSPLPRGT